MRQIFHVVLTLVALCCLSEAQAFADDDVRRDSTENVASDDADPNASGDEMINNATNEPAAEQCVALTISKYSKYSLRALPQSDAEVVGKLDGKTKSVCYTEVRDNWLKINYNDQDAYICACVTDASLPMPQKVKLVTKQRVYEQPSHTSFCEQELNEGTEVETISQKGCWYEISASHVNSENASERVHGYIDSCDVTFVE